VEPDGITVIDFKTDRVSEETLPQLLDRYAPQVQTYVQALERIYRKPVKEALLYFFGLGRFAKV
jgi:ATP-dependent helicase/nuclease subunit A